MIFEFECSCGHIFDVVTNDDVKKANCPKCGRAVRKIISICFC